MSKDTTHGLIVKTSPVFIISGDPIAWARPGRTKTGKIYDTQKDEKDDYKLIIQSQWHEKIPYSSALHMDATFFMPFSNKKQHELDWHTYYPDIDNLCKFLMDAAKDLYVNDSIIASIAARKMYSSHPHTEFTLTIL
jgi:Holliday junction resolvase RusA-like endonuclease